MKERFRLPFLTDEQFKSLRSKLNNKSAEYDFELQEKPWWNISDIFDAGIIKPSTAEGEQNNNTFPKMLLLSTLSPSPRPRPKMHTVNNGDLFSS